jgi:peptidoglycan hydrolase-like protein with peptidoglycan-binding domain
MALARIAKLQSGDTSNPTRNLSDASNDDRVAEDQIGLDKGQRRDVQRRLTRLGFDVHVTGKFDDETRGVIKRWQAVRGYPDTGYLSKEQHAALISENLAARAPSENEDSSSSSSSDDDSRSHRARHYSGGGGGGRHYYARGGGAGPGAFFGHMMGGLFH